MPRLARCRHRPHGVISAGMMLAGLAVGLAGCASAPPASLAQAHSDMQTALTSGPESYTRAQWDEARLKLNQADEAARDDDMAKADRLAQESSADLRLGRSMADAQHAQTAERDVQTTIDTLQSQTNGPAAAPPPGGPPRPMAPPPPQAQPMSPPQPR